MVDKTAPKVLLLSFSPLERDPRVLRQATFLRPHYQITSAGYGSATPDLPGFIGIPSPRTSIAYKSIQAIRLKAQRFEEYYWAQPHVRDAWNTLQSHTFDAVLANDLSALPLAVRIADNCGAQVVLDVHEYEPRHFEGNFTFDFFFRGLWHYIAQTYLAKAVAMTTVCQGIADLYKKEYSADSTVLTNAPYHSDLPPTEVQTDNIRIIHHGICNQARGIESMIELMDALDERFTLDLMLVKTDDRSYSAIQKLAEDTPKVGWRQPVATQNIVSTINSYDIGLCMFPPSTPTLRMALPNKFFEFIQAKLSIATWPSQELVSIVEQTGCGVVSKNFDIASMASALNKLSRSEIQSHKTKAVKAAQRHCAENNEAILLDLMQLAINRKT